MRIDRLYVKNFRNFAENRFSFNPHFTVVIGVNGRGKSSILHALRVAAGTYLLGIPTAAKRHIQSDEVRMFQVCRAKASVRRLAKSWSKQKV